MKFQRTLLAAALVIFSSASLAQAATTDLGTTYVGETGTITENSAGLLSDLITGILPDDAKITLSYTITGLTGSTLSDVGSYSYNSMGTHYYGSSMSFTNGTNTLSNSQGYTNPTGQPKKISSVSSLVLTSANLSGNNGTAVITNNSLGQADFMALLTGKLKKGGEVIVTYTVSALSSVPLPPSAYLFGLGLALFAGIGMMKRQQARA